MHPSWECLDIHNIPLAKFLSSKGLVPKQSTDYYATVCMCLISEFIVLLLCYVLSASFVFDFWFSLWWWHTRAVGCMNQSEVFRSIFFACRLFYLEIETNRQQLADKFAVSQTTGSLCRHYLAEFCGIIWRVHMRIPFFSVASLWSKQTSKHRALLPV